MGARQSFCSRRSESSWLSRCVLVSGSHQVQDPQVVHLGAAQRPGKQAHFASAPDADGDQESQARKRIRITSAVSGDNLCEVHAETSWDAARLKTEIESLTGTASAHQHLMVGDLQVNDGEKLAAVLPRAAEGQDEGVSTLSLLKVSWVDALSNAFPEIHQVRNVLLVQDMMQQAGCITQLLGEEWLQCSTSQQLSSIASTVDYFVTFKFEIADSWRQTCHWGQILLFTANGFPPWEQYPFRCPNFVLECNGEPKLLVIVSNKDDDNQHISSRGLACTDYDLPTGIEISVMLAVSGDTAAVYIDGKEVIRERVGKREAHECMEVYANPPNRGWIGMHGYEVPNKHVRIRQVHYVAFPT